MIYTTIADLVNEYGDEEITGLSDRTGSGVRDDSVINARIADACAIIDTYLRARYLLPISDAEEVPLILNIAARDIVRWMLYSEPTDYVLMRLRFANEKLEGIRDGTIELPLPASTQDLNADIAETQTQFRRPDTALGGSLLTDYIESGVRYGNLNRIFPFD